MPAITGYIATGFLLGPGVLGWLDDAMLADSRACWRSSRSALIVFDLGRRLDLGWARHDRWLLPMGIAESALSFAAMFALLRFVVGIDMLEAAVAATVGIATAPAVVLLVTNELKAEGPVTRRMLWHVALNNVIATRRHHAAAAVRRGAHVGRVVESRPHARYGSSPDRSCCGFVVFQRDVAVRALARQVAGAAVHPRRRVPSSPPSAPPRPPACRCCSRCSCSARAHAISIARHRLIDVEFGRAAQVFFVVLFVLTGATLRLDQFGTIAWIGLAFVIAPLRSARSSRSTRSPGPRTSPRARQAPSALALTPIAGLAIGMTQPIYDIAPEFGARLAAIVVVRRRDPAPARAHRHALRADPRRRRRAGRARLTRIRNAAPPARLHVTLAALRRRRARAEARQHARLQPRAGRRRSVARATREAPGGELKPEITQSMVEINTSVHERYPELLAELQGTRDVLDRAARKMNVAIAGGGTHPFQKWSDAQDLSDRALSDLSRRNTATSQSSSPCSASTCTSAARTPTTRSTSSTR